MRVEYDNKTYDFDLDEITVGQARVIKSAYGLTLKGLQDGLEEGDPDALASIFWLMATNSGERIDIRHVDFKIVKFAEAIQAANDAEQEAKDAELADEEVAKIKAERNKAETAPKGSRP